jgi:hypothetical protein
MVGNMTSDVAPTCSASSSSFDTCRPRPNSKLSGIIVCTGLDSLERKCTVATWAACQHSRHDPQVPKRVYPTEEADSRWTRWQH